mgnify:CR=1 FL=1
MSITIPESVESIGYEAFGENPLEEVVIQGLTTRFDEMWLDIGLPKSLATFITTTDDGIEFNKMNGFLKITAKLMDVEKCMSTVLEYFISSAVLL